MNRLVLAVGLALFVPAPSIATTIAGNTWIRDRVGIGTTAPMAALDVVNSSSSATGLQVSTDWGDPLFAAASSATLGIGVQPSANLDVWGYGDDGTVALELRSGSLGAPLGDQLVFGANGTRNLGHAIRSVHVSTATGGRLDFLLWTPAVSTPSVGNLNILSLVAMSTFSSFHVMPAGTPWFEVEVSNGLSVGQGVVHRASEQVPSSRKRKTEIRYLPVSEEEHAEADVLALKHVRFRYMVPSGGKLVRDKKQPLRRGLILEDSPESIKGPQGTLCVDDRLFNVELALKKVLTDLERIEAEVGQ